MDIVLLHAGCTGSANQVSVPLSGFYGLLRAPHCAMIRRRDFARKKKMASNVYARTLNKAAELLGGRKTLARHLRVPMAELEMWLKGDKEPPMGVFLKTVDVLLQETGPGGAG